MKVPQLVIAISAVVLVTLAAGTAHATTPIPASCDINAQTRGAYKQGNLLGERLVTQAWNTIHNDCDRIDYFLQVVQDNVSRLTLLPNASVNTICRYTGTADGVYNKLDALYGTCADDCFIDGTFAGQLSGEIYCELSIALGGLVEADDFLRGPVAVCGFSFEIGCDSQFISTTTEFVTPAPSPQACEQYTEGEFAEVWDQARNNQCAYEPIPPPHSNLENTSESGL